MKEVRTHLSLHQVHTKTARSPIGSNSVPVSPALNEIGVERTLNLIPLDANCPSPQLLNAQKDTGFNSSQLISSDSSNMVIKGQKNLQTEEILVGVSLTKEHAQNKVMDSGLEISLAQMSSRSYEEFVTVRPMACVQYEGVELTTDRLQTPRCVPELVYFKHKAKTPKSALTNDPVMRILQRSLHTRERRPEIEACAHPGCGQYFLSSRELHQHVSISHTARARSGAFRCDEPCCNFAHTAALQLAEHWRNAHQHPVSWCYRCVVPYKNFADWRLHWTQHEQEEVRETKEPPQYVNNI